MLSPVSIGINDNFIIVERTKEQDYEEYVNNSIELTQMIPFLLFALAPFGFTLSRFRRFYNR